ncbi:hypothetical protein QBC38DRAFT_219311 [Podospora fimiseda]|uniref:F-box domain-containing protein n=1 Tax=Podospora fimiseda TaxID=252190 RepID=A0AAN7BPJ3_9PEZI|nr:hypothetical protein QBC38DRAFT_219311 [Podospora fimiseda]
MASANDSHFFTSPSEQRDQQDEAEFLYNRPLREKNQQLEEENLKLKQLLRESGISWSPSLILDPNREHGIWAESTWPSGKKGTRPRPSRTTATRSSARHERRLPSLPTEIHLRILEYAMTSDFPIIDPLCKLDQESITSEEKKRGNQIAIGFLSTCRAYHVEGTEFLWSNNTFIFTSHSALRTFANVDLQYRRNIKHITMRIIAKYYDDDEDRRHIAPHPVHEPSRSRTMHIPTHIRTKEDTMARRGFKSYTWLQVVDFLDALRPPFDPKHVYGQPRPRLLPGLESLRIDLVNCPPEFLNPPGGPALHNLASHDLASTLNELQITGITDCQWGADLSNQLARMVKDDGLLLKHGTAFMQGSKGLRRITKGEHAEWRMRVVRAWKVLAKEYAEAQKRNGNPAPLNHHLAHREYHANAVRAAPEEEDHPPTIWKVRRTLWKKVPLSRECEDRDWVEFDRTSGFRIHEEQYGDDSFDVYDEDELVCHHCGVMHSPYEEDY